MKPGSERGEHSAVLLRSRIRRRREGMTRNLILLCVAFAALGGCGPGADRVAPTRFRDSAGIRIAESDPEAGALPTWTVSESPALEIGVVDGDVVYKFYNITGVARLANGDIVVANSGTGELRLYAPDGGHRRSTGGTGEGPGEYRYLRTLLHLAGDSLLAADALTYRLTVYDAGLDAVRSWQAPELGPFTAPPPVARVAAGRWLALTSRTIGDIPGAVEFRMLLVTYDDDGSAVDTIAELPGPRSLIEPCGPDLKRMCNRGSRFPAVVRVAVAGDSIFAGNGDGFEIRVLNASGRLAGVWRVAAPPRPVTDAELERDRALLLASAPSDDVRRQLDREYARTPVPAVMPAYSKILADDDGNISGRNVSHVLRLGAPLPRARPRWPAAGAVRAAGHSRRAPDRGGLHSRHLEG